MTYQLHKKVLAEDYPDGRTRVWGRCKVSGELYECWVPTAGLAAWQSGELIQRAMPEVSAEAREFVFTGVSPTGWEQLFGKRSEG